MRFLALLPGICIFSEASGLGQEGQYGDGVRFFLLPLREKVARMSVAKFEPDEGRGLSVERNPSSGTDFVRATFSRKGRRKIHTSSPY